MWDLPGPGIELVSPALQGRFLTRGMPGKPGISALWKTVSPQTPQGSHRIDWESLDKIFIGQNCGRDSVTQEHPQRPCPLSPCRTKAFVCVFEVKGSNEHTHPQGAGQNPGRLGNGRGNSEIPTPAEGAGLRSGLRDTDKATPLGLLDTRPD